MDFNLPVKKEKPWGYELLYALTENYAGKIIHVKKGHRLSLQFHQDKEETMYFYSGLARVETGQDADNLEQFTIREGEHLHLPPGTCHRIEALEDTVILEVSTPQLEDVVRLADDYGRHQS